MRNAHIKYMCFPSVAPVGKEIEVTITPRDTSRIFREENEYELSIIGFFDDLADYHEPIPKTHPFTVKNGCLCFKHTFEREQEYSVRFCRKGEKETRISLYAVDDDLYQLRPLKGDLHTHTFYSDGQDGLAMTAADYREEGYDFFSLTDHNRMYTSVLLNELYKDVPLGMHIMTGEEVHTPGSVLHIVHAGGKSSVCNKYIKDDASYQSGVDAIEKTLDNIPQSYRRRVAMAKWACEEIHKAGGIAILAHPHWTSNIYNISDEFCDILFEQKMFDAFEVMGGLGSKNNNQQLALWFKHTLNGNHLPVVGSSDSHDHNFDKTVFGRRFTIVFAKDNTTESILEAIKNDMCVAADIPMADNNEVRFYSKNYRLVMFAHFLYQNYFNETWRLCVGEGILMRRYAEGEDVGTVLASLSDTVENFYKKFYGKLAAPVIGTRTREFLDKALDIQRNVGPVTKGSALHVYGGNERRE